MLALKSLVESSKKIQKNDFYARVYRINWRFLEERIFYVFEKLKAEYGNHFESFGNIYLSVNIKEHNKQFKTMPVCEKVNSVHVTVGHKSLCVGHVEDGKFKWLTECNAQLWYAQSPNGDVMVFVSPYRSKTHEMNESEIVIDYVSNPSHLSLKRIDKHFSIFFKYCASSSINSTGSISSYFYRLWLLYRDFRFKAKRRSNIVNFFLKVVPVLSLVTAITAIFVALYNAGNLS